MADDREARLDRACTEYLCAADAGRPPERAAWLTAHPDLATELSAFLAGLNSVESLLAPLREDRDATVVRATPTDTNSPAMPDGYEVLGPIAEGGMGVVYRARQVQAGNREVALKMIRAGVLAGESAVQRFRVEAEAAAGFHHPNIVTVHEVGVTASGQPFFSMKLIDGPTLTDWLAAHPPTTDVSLRQAVRLLAAVCRAVHYAHQRGFLHRDLKPGNILVDAAGVPHVTDFGLAKRIGERPSDVQLTEAGGLVGTLAYMAPEQARGGERLTTAADVYPLGAILFKMLTGNPLRTDPVDELLKGTLGRIPPVFAPSTDRDLEAICRKCLSEDPAGRYGSAEALADELDRWAAGKPIRTRPPRLTRRLWLWVRRRPGSAAFAATAVVLATVGAALVTWKWRDAQRESSQSAAVVARSYMEPEADGDNRELGTAALWWVRSVEGAPVTDTELRRTARANLAALTGRLHTLRQVRQTGQRPRPEPVTAVSRDGRWRAEATESEVRVFEGDRQIGKPIVHDDLVRAVGFFRDGRLLTGGDEHDARVWRYSGQTGWRPEARLEHQDYVRAVAFSPDERLVATGGADGVAQVWEVGTWRRVGQRLPHTGWVERLAFSADGRELTTTTADGTERVWVLSAAAHEDRYWDFGAPVFAVAPTPDRRAVYVGTENGVYDLATASPLTSLTPFGTKTTWAVAVHPTGEWVAAGGPEGQNGWFAVFRPNGTVIDDFKLQRPVRSIAVTPDGSRVLFTTATTQDGGLWEWKQGTPDAAPVQLGPSQPTWVVAVTPDGGKFVTSEGDGRLRIQPTGEEINLPQRVVALAAFPDSRRVAAGSTDEVVRIWRGGRETPDWAGRHRGAVWALSVSPNGNWMAGGGRDRSVRLWDADTGRAVGAPLAHSAVVWVVAFSPDGRWVWSGSEDGTVRRRLAPFDSLDVSDGRLRGWAERVSGLTLDGDRSRPLTPAEWAHR